MYTLVFMYIHITYTYVESGISTLIVNFCNSPHITNHVMHISLFGKQKFGDQVRNLGIEPKFRIVMEIHSVTAVRSLTYVSRGQSLSKIKTTNLADK